MNTEQFKECVRALTLDELNLLGTGKSLCMEEDKTLTIGSDSDANRIITDASNLNSNPESLREQLLEQADELVTQFYRTHPLTKTGFNQQVRLLVQQYGAEQFAAVGGQRAKRTLFVDVGEVLAEKQGEPRYPYGSYFQFSPGKSFEFTSGNGNSSIENLVVDWIDNGEAYEQYLSMNVCRYNC